MVGHIIHKRKLLSPSSRGVCDRLPDWYHVTALFTQDIIPCDICSNIHQVLPPVLLCIVSILKKKEIIIILHEVNLPTYIVYY